MSAAQFAARRNVQFICISLLTNMQIICILPHTGTRRPGEGQMSTETEATAAPHFQIKNRWAGAAQDATS